MHKYVPSRARNRRAREDQHAVSKFTAVPYVQPSPRRFQGQAKDRALYANGIATLSSSRTRTAIRDRLSVIRSHRTSLHNLNSQLKSHSQVRTLSLAHIVYSNFAKSIAPISLVRSSDSRVIAS